MLNLIICYASSVVWFLTLKCHYSLYISKISLSIILKSCFPPDLKLKWIKIGGGSQINHNRGGGLIIGVRSEKGVYYVYW